MYFSGFTEQNVSFVLLHTDNLEIICKIQIKWHNHSNKVGTADSQTLRRMSLGSMSGSAWRC